MISPTNLQAQRFELKYLADESTALKAREFVRSHLAIDPYAGDRPDYSYPVHSLYLDSDKLRLYWETINGNMNRFKLRARCYRFGTEDPLFLEIKRRQNDAILKRRAVVKRASLPELLAGRLPRMDDLTSANPRQLATLREFIDLMVRHEAHPKTRVTYRREAWISTHDNSVRVTIDRGVVCAPEDAPRLEDTLHQPQRVFGHQVVIEIKFTNRFPDWFGELVRVLGLRQGSAAKYVDGVTCLGEWRFHPRAAARRSALRARLAQVNSAVSV